MQSDKYPPYWGNEPSYTSVDWRKLHRLPSVGGGVPSTPYWGECGAYHSPSVIYGPYNTC